MSGGGPTWSRTQNSPLICCNGVAAPHRDSRGVAPWRRRLELCLHLHQPEVLYRQPAFVVQVKSRAPFMLSDSLFITRVM